MPTMVRPAQKEPKTDTPQPSSTTGPKRDLKSVQVNPIPVIAGGVVLAATLCWFMWLGPKSQEDRAVKEWTSPAAAAARAPGSQPKDATHEAFLQTVHAKQGGEVREPRARRSD